MNRFAEASSAESGDEGDDDVVGDLLPDIEEVKRKIEEVRVDLADAESSRVPSIR